jgi:protein-disulfide isomerase
MKLKYSALAVMLVTGMFATALAMAEGQSVTTVSADAATTPASADTHPVASAAPAFTPEQEARIGEVAKEYLLAHPDVLVEVSQELEAQQQEAQRAAMTQAVLGYQDALLDNKSTPSYGPADAKVAFIEFFDYQCSVCTGQALVIESLMKANPQVRYVFKEWPIFAQRWSPSLMAAKTGLQVWQQKGPDAYLAYHNALYAFGHDEGRLTLADINRAAAKAGKLKGKSDEMLEVLSRTDTLAQNLGLRGTPGMIVMPVNGATAENVTVIPGGADQGVLQAAIDKAAGQPRK